MGFFFYLFGLLFVYFSFWFCACVCFLLFVICFVLFLKRERVWSWMGREVGKIWKELGKEENVNKIYCMKTISFNKQNIFLKKERETSNTKHSEFVSLLCLV